uniref:Peptidase C1A papain C-terminal domain-containing protein n=1 Tax=Chrysemys picta bellii TaxID=8478 RepID=A0A8C3PDY4_CHRPI
MQEFVGRIRETDRVHHRLFHHYKEKFRKTYSTEKEMEHRKRTFIHNMRYGAIWERKGGTRGAEVGSVTLCEKELFCKVATFPWKNVGDVKPPKLSHCKPSCPVTPPSPGAVTPVKDQAVCGSCWSFATTGAMEGALFLKTGVLTPLSQQVLIDCSWGFGNHACDGGEEWQAYEWIKKHGGLWVCHSVLAPVFPLQNGYCHYNQSELIAKVAGYINVDSGNITALKAALYKHGPVAVNIDASPKTFAFYANGVYYEPACGDTELDHAVLAVGYGVLQGESYWLIKNSWSTYWGNDGYILMSMRDNNCGVTTAATYPVLA